MSDKPKATRKIVKPLPRKKSRLLTAIAILSFVIGLLFVFSAFYSAKLFTSNDSIFFAEKETQEMFLYLALAFAGFLFVIAIAIFARSRTIRKSAKRLALELDRQTAALNRKRAKIAEEEAARIAAEQAAEDAKREAAEAARRQREAERAARRAEKEKAEAEEAELEPRFYALSQIDERMQTYSEPECNDTITLSELCERFRNFAAYRLGLYYDIEDIRRFIAGMTVSHILIMQGMSGTGKTSLAFAFGEFIKNQSTIVPIQPMWKERTDLVGYYNEFTKHFNETTLLEKMYEANYRGEMFVVVLDEMNIARVEYYFAEFLSLLEIPNVERRYIDVVTDVWDNDPKLLRDGQLRLPANMWFIGTANNDDSTFAISDKVYDRSMVMNLDKKSEVFTPEATDGLHISFDYFEELGRRARKDYRMTGRNRRRLRALDRYMIDKFKITFGNRIMKQIEQYIPAFLACGGDEVAALDDILSKKLFRKLEAQNPIYVRNSVEALCIFLDELFGFDKMPLCKEFLHKFERSA